jgi:hypothetical protein
MSRGWPTIRHTSGWDAARRLASSRNTLSAHVGGAAVRAPRSRTGRLDRWRKSSTFRQIARNSAKANIAAFNAAPRCGAARKRDGKPCCNPAMKNGRCGLHGGKTPRGRQWHVIQLPDCSTPAGEAKFNRKLRNRNRYAVKRAARLAAMTPEQRAKHDAWHRSHPPGGSRASRSVKSDRVRQDADLRRLLAESPSLPTPGPELVRIRTALAVARAKLARLDAKAGKSTDDNEGVFS